MGIGGDWCVEKMDDDCECGEGVMSGDGSGGVEGEEACESDVGDEGERKQLCLDLRISTF